MKKTIQFFIVFIFSFIPIAGINNLQAQITSEEARAVDSLMLFSGYFQSPILHSTNYFSGSNGQGYFIFTWGCGLDTDIEDYCVSWTGIDYATAQQEQDINAQAGEAFKRFDLNDYNDSTEYRIALQGWLNSLGIPVDIVNKEFPETDFVVYPVPAGNKVTVRGGVKADRKGVIKVFSATGRLMLNMPFNGTAQFDVTHWPSGLYFLLLEQNGKRYLKWLPVQ